MTKYYDTIGRKNPPRIKREIKTDKPISGKRKILSKDDKEIRVFIEEIDWYLENGWKLGRSQKIKDSIREISLATSIKGKLIIHNKELKQVKVISSDELENYINSGWERGYLNKKKKKTV